MRIVRLAPLAIAAIAALAAPHHAEGHAGPRLADPAPGATLRAAPEIVRLSFSERPDPALSTIRVLDTDGVAFHAGRPERLDNDPLGLSVRLKALPRGVYTVSWRIVSAVDGHATAGSYAFGVGMAPSGAVTAALVQEPPALEVQARWILIAGFVVLLGATAATAARFGGSGDIVLAVGGWVLAAAGLALFAAAQARNAGVPLVDLAGSSIGLALVLRAAAFAAAGAALAAAARPSLRRHGMTAAGVCALIAIGVHAASGHAGAGRGMQAVVAIASQWAHIAAAGVWLGGLAALLLATRGAPADGKADAVRRFSTIAAAGLAIVVVTGALRTFNELESWRDLFGNPYGQGVLAKMVLGIGIAGFAAFNRRTSVPRAAATLVPLRLAGGGELLLTVAALGAAAWIGTLPPPASGVSIPRRVVVSGADFGTTVRATLTIASDAPGPNRFELRAEDYDSGAAVQAERVNLRFTPLDDPGTQPTTLPLERQPDGSFAASGSNMSFDGRWQIAALIERAGDSVEIPLEVEARVPPQLISVERPPGAAATYTAEVARAGFIRLSAQPERAGRSTLTITCQDVIFEPRPLETMTVTSLDDGAVRQLAVRSQDRVKFTAEADLRRGTNTFVVVARTVDGTRLRAAFNIEIHE